MSKYTLLSRLRADNDKGTDFGSVLKEQLDAGPLDASVTKLCIDLESDANPQAAATVDNSVSRITAALTTAASLAGIELSTPSLESATLGVLLATSPKNFLDHMPTLPEMGVKSSRNGVSLTLPYDSSKMARPSMESFDETTTRSLISATARYNQASAASQAGIDALFFPSEVGDPTNTIVTKSMSVPVIQDDIVRSTDGSVTPFGYQALMRAHRDDTILADTSTRIYPIVRGSTVGKLTPASLVPPREVIIDGVESMTAPMLFGERYDLLGLSQPDNMVARGLNDSTDVIHPAISLDTIYMAINEDPDSPVINFYTRDLMSAAMTEGTSGRDRAMTLAFSNGSITINRHTLLQDGTLLNDFGGLDLTAGWMVRLEVQASGSTNLATGNSEVFMNNVRVSSVTNPAGELMPVGSAEYIAAQDAVEGMVGAGYDLHAHRSNINRRQIGRILEQITFSQVFPVPYGSPISIVRPTDEQSHGVLTVDSLIYASQLKSYHNAVNKLFETRDRMRVRQTNPNDGNHFDEVMGIGSLAVRPAYLEVPMDMPAIVDSLSSSDRRDDIAASFENIIRNVGYQLYTESEISTAADYYLGANRRPVLKVATSPTIAQYLSNMTNTSYEDVVFEVRVASDISKRMENKIFITLHYDSADSDQFNPCQFGMRVMYPEIIAARNPTFRQGAQSNVLTVTPHFDHFVTMHVLGYIEVSGLGKILGKLGLCVNTDCSDPDDLLLGTLNPVGP